MTNAKKAPPASKGGRVHVVLVPGFAGFDALGQVEYYAGVTPQFQAWKETGNKRRERVALHYFDNFPTAAVRTRAARLRSYLTKRITRGEIQPNDSIALVGHSTAGLDIRKLLWDLASNPDCTYPVDGAQSSQGAVSAGDLLEWSGAWFFSPFRSGAPISRIGYAHIRWAGSLWSPTCGLP